MIGYLKIIFNFVSLVKNNFRRRQIAVSDLSLTDMSRRVCVALVAITTLNFGQARNDGKGFQAA